MHTVSVRAIHDCGDIVEVWDRNYSSTQEAQTKGLSFAQSVILADSYPGVRLYQVVLPYDSGDEVKTFSRFFQVSRTLVEVLK